MPPGSLRHGPLVTAHHGPRAPRVGLRHQGPPRDPGWGPSPGDPELQTGGRAALGGRGASQTQLTQPHGCWIEWPGPKSAPGCRGCPTPSQSAAQPEAKASPWGPPNPRGSRAAIERASGQRRGSLPSAARTPSARTLPDVGSAPAPRSCGWGGSGGRPFRGQPHEGLSPLPSSVRAAGTAPGAGSGSAGGRGATRQPDPRGCRPAAAWVGPSGARGR